MPFIASATGSFFSGRRATAFSSTPYNPSVNIPNSQSCGLIQVTLQQQLTVAQTLTAITDKTGTATMSITNTPSKGTSNGLETIVFDQSFNEYLSSDTTAQAASGNHWALFIGQIATPDNTKDSQYGVLKPINHLKEIMLSVPGNASAV